MPRRKHHDKIKQYDLDDIDRQMVSLRRALDRAALSLTPFRAHDEAISELKVAMHRCMNLLNDRPADYVEPLAAPTQGYR